MGTPSQTPVLRALPGYAGTPGQMPDHLIVEGLLQGDPAAAEAVYDRCHQAVENSIARVLRARDGDFEDLVQLAFEKVLVSIHRGRFKGDFSLARWASSIATHAAIDVLRGRTRDKKRLEHGREPDQVLSLVGSGLERRIEARSEIERIHRVLAKVPRKQAEAFLLHEVYGYELQEVAATLQISVAATQSRALRGKKELLRRLGVEAEGDAQ